MQRLPKDIFPAVKRRRVHQETQTQMPALRRKKCLPAHLRCISAYLEEKLKEIVRPVLSGFDIEELLKKHLRNISRSGNINVD